MRVNRKLAALILVAVVACSAAGPPKQWRETFDVDKAHLGPSGDNPYFPLRPGIRLHFRDGAQTSVMTFLAETKMIDGVETRVVEDREEKNGQPTEITRDYYAIDSTTGDVYYFGEEVDIYKKGKLAGHAGSWMSGVGGAQFGLMMPARIGVGDRFVQERAPKQAAQDRSEVVETGVRLTTPAGSYENCVHMRDSSAIERGGDHKWYAPGIGLVKDGKAVLVKVEK
jgi:hypothetical protein